MDFITTITTMTSLAAFLMVIGGPVEAYQRYQNAATRRCLDSDDQGAFGYIYTSGCNNGDYQKWDIGYSRLQNYQTHFCLSAFYGGGVHTEDCSVPYGDYAPEWQKWTPLSYTENNQSYVFLQITLSGPLGATYTLDSDTAGNVYTNAYNGGFYQRWIEI